MRKTNRHTSLAILAVVSVAVLFSPSVAGAELILPEGNIRVGPASSPMAVTTAMLEASSDSVIANPDGSFSFVNGSMSTANWEWTWSDLTVKTDPFVSSAFGFKNLAAVTMPFVISVSLPVAPILPSTLMGGSMGGSVTDSFPDGLGGIATIAPDALYTGTIDGVGVVPAAELHADPFSSAPFAFGGDTVAIPPVSFGLPGPTVPGPAVLATIGIVNKFTLSPGDSVAMTNFFIVEVVPEPSSIVLAVFAGAALVWFAARRRWRS
jgi:hypothetical protein